jgi:KAP family P-loop domain
VAQSPNSSFVDNLKSNDSSSALKSNDSSSAQNVWFPKFSQAVKGAMDRLSSERTVSSAQVVREILRYRTKYAGSKGRDMLKLIDAQLKETNSFSTDQASRWIERVTDLYLYDRLPGFHGRHLIIGLAMLDNSLRELLLTNSFLNDLLPELKEIPEDIVSDQGKLYLADLLISAENDENEYLQNKDDNPIKDVKDDSLDRAKFADFVVKLFNKTSLKSGAFSIHLYAPWGAGKTSFLNFMKRSLQDKKITGNEIKWHVIDFNAWQNQNIPYPWWNFMNNIYAKIKHELPWRYRLKESFWRFRAQRMHQAFALLIICLLLFFFVDSRFKNNASELDPLSKLLAALVGIWGIAISFSQSFVKGSQKTAQDYLEGKDNPMADYKEKFKQLVSAISPARIAIFIDDLDRCKSGYVVELLENIQTLFQDSNVVFVIAADMTWLHASYEVEYEKIKGFIHVEGKTIGPLFIEKMFQLSIALPGVPEKIKEQCWAGMLGLNTEFPPAVKASEPSVGPASTHDINTEEFKKDHQERLDKLDDLAKKETVDKTEHYLEPFSRYLDLNPRNMKRLLNNYLINKASSLISHIDIPKRQLVLYTILNIQWPVLASFLIKYPECLNNRNDLPDEIMDLLRQDEVIAVLEGRGFNDPLTEATLIQCGLLFSFVNYHHYMPKAVLRQKVQA